MKNILMLLKEVFKNNDEKICFIIFLINWYQRDLFVFLNFLPSFFLPDYKRARLHQSISSIFSNADVFSYSSARGALGSCLEALDLSDTDEVLLSSFSCLAVPSAVIYAGAKPVYSDVSLNDLNVSLETILEAINPNTKVIVVQHTMGMTFRVDQLKQAIIG